MSEGELRNSKLVELYHRYVGEPGSKRSVYGYWLFLLGCIAGLSGVLVYLTEQVLFPGDLAIREVAIVLAASGLTVASFGIIVLLPVRRRGIHASVLGVLISFAGIAAFVWAYPQYWYFPPDYTAEIVAVYTTGIALLVSVAVLVPIITGEKGLLVEPELGIGDDNPPIMIGESARDIIFTVYRTGSRTWTWRAIQRDAVGESTQTAPTDTDALLHLEDVREKFDHARLLEITTAAFRLYRTEADEWRWSLVRRDGSVLGTSDELYADRQTIDSKVNFLKEHAPAADIIEIRGAAFDIHEDDGGRWHWRMVDDQRQPLATSADNYASSDDADAGVEGFVGLLADARILTLDPIGIELYHSDDGWHWRVVNAHDRRLVTSDAAYASRRAAETAATGTADHLTDAAVIEHGTTGYEVYKADGTWHWQLRNAVDDRIFTSYDTHGNEPAAVEEAELTREVVPHATVIEFAGADYEVYPADDAWHWRLVADDRTVLAESTERFPDDEAAVDAADRVREQALAADLIEFEQAAFQQYESDGEWRWRLIDNDGKVMADSGEEYASREAVRDGMMTLKEHAPNAEVLEIETAAFEIYRTDNDAYAWRLIDEAGNQIAESAHDRPSRTATRESVEFLLDHLADAAVRPMADAVFQLYTDAETWGFWLVHPDGRMLAVDTGEYLTRDEAVEAIHAIQAAGADAVITSIGSVTIQLRNGPGWHYQLITPDRELIGQGNRTYDTPEAAREDIGLLTGHAADAPLFELGPGVLWAHPLEEGWNWRLVDTERTVVATGAHAYDTREAVMEAIETVRTRAPDAGYMDINTLAFEVHRGDDHGWRWRLLDETETVRGISAVEYDLRDDATDVIPEVRETAREASILEIDEIAFEFHEREDGWIWRLIDETGTPLAESVTRHETRHDAHEELLTVKEHAPTGEAVIS